MLLYRLHPSKLDWCQCGNSLALWYLALVMELPDSLWINCKSEFGIIFLRGSQDKHFCSYMLMINWSLILSTAANHV